MKSKYHTEITWKVLKDYFTKKPLKVIIWSNIKQDRLKNQIGRDFIHFDGSAFFESFNYINSEEAKMYQSIQAEDYPRAWASLGHILHSWQDFYSHSNYTQLWLQKVKDSPPEGINHDDPDIFNHPDLQSGKNYGMFDLLALIPGISKLVMPLMPSDSHARMNLDSPKSGSNFIYAYHAALKRTITVIEEIFDTLNQQEINQDMIVRFMGN